MTEKYKAAFVAVMAALLGGAAPEPTHAIAIGLEGWAADYPKDALRHNIQGTVVIQFMVNTEGRTENCVVLAPLFPSLDNASCAVSLRFRFRPAMDEFGVPMNSVVQKNIKWIIPAKK